MNTTVKAAKKRKSTRVGNSSQLKHYPLADQAISYVFIAFIAMFLIAAPFFRGLYFREEYTPAIIYMSSLFAIYMIYRLIKKDHRFFNSYMDAVMLLLPVVYLISFFVSVNPRDAFDAVLKYAVYFMLYKVVADLCKESVYRKAIEFVVLTSLLVMASVNLRRIRI